MSNDSHFYRVIPVLLLVVALQTTWLAGLQIAGVHLDLPLLVAVSVALLGGATRGAFTGFFAGLLTGYFAPWHLGSFVMSRTIGAGAFGFFRRGFSLENPLAPPICAAGATILSDFVFLMMSPTDFSLGWWLHHAGIAAILHAVVIWPIHWLLARLCTPRSRMMFA